MVIVLLTEERPEPEMAIRLALLVLDLPLWNSEEDLAVHSVTNLQMVIVL